MTTPAEKRALAILREWAKQPPESTSHPWWADAYCNGMRAGFLVAIKTCERIMESRRQERAKARAHGQTCVWLQSEGDEIIIALEQVIRTAAPTKEPKA